MKANLQHNTNSTVQLLKIAYLYKIELQTGIVIKKSTKCAFVLFIYFLHKRQ